MPQQRSLPIAPTAPAPQLYIASFLSTNTFTSRCGYERIGVDPPKVLKPPSLKRPTVESGHKKQSEKGILRTWLHAGPYSHDSDSTTSRRITVSTPRRKRKPKHVPKPTQVHTQAYAQAHAQAQRQLSHTRSASTRDPKQAHPSIHPSIHYWPLPATLGWATRKSVAAPTSRADRCRCFYRTSTRTAGAAAAARARQQLISPSDPTYRP